MLKRHSVRFNYIMNLLLKLSAIAFPLVTFPYITRVLTAAGVGRVAFAVSITEYFGLLAVLGIPTYGIKACARVRDNPEELRRVALELLAIQFMMTGVALVLFALTVATVPKLRREPLLYTVEMAALLLNAIDTSWFAAALEQYDFIAVRTIVIRALTMALMFGAVRSQADYVRYALVMLLFTAGSQAVNMVFFKRHLYLHSAARLNLRRHIKPILLCFGQSVAITIYTNLDTVMLGFMKNDEVVGLYNVAVKIKLILVSVVTALGGVLLPRLSYYIQEGNNNAFAKTIRWSVHFALLMALPLAAFFVFAAEDCILIIAGSGYVGAITPMRIIMPTLVFIGLSNVTGYGVLLPTNREGAVLVSVGAGAAVNFGFNAMLIPFMGAAGAALGTLITETAVLGIQLYYVGRDREYYFSKCGLGRILSAALVSLLSLAGIGFAGIHNVYIRFALCVGSYYGSYALLLVLLREPMFCALLREGAMRIAGHSKHDGA